MLNPALKTARVNASGRPHVRVERGPGRVLLVASEAWVVRELPQIEAELAALRVLTEKNLVSAEADLSAITEFDTAGAWLLHRILSGWKNKSAQVIIRGASEKHKILLEEVARNSKANWPSERRQSSVARLSNDAVASMFSLGRDAVRLTGFLGEVTLCAGRLMLRPWRFRSTSFVHHLETAGLRAVPIISLICLLIGAVIMQQGIVQLRAFGAEVLSVDTLGILALREIGVLLCAILVAGRSASAFTAELGTMKMREEIDALRTLGIDPLETLVLPRILALIIALPLLVFLGDMMCLAGGAVMAKIYLGLDLPLYLQRLNSAVEIRHFFVGMVKAPFAALVIGLVGCLEGLSVEGSAESVGKHVTSAVVKAIFLVMALDGFFAIFLSASGF